MEMTDHQYLDHYESMNEEDDCKKDEESCEEEVSSIRCSLQLCH